jgi:hypothetical protein
VIVLFFFFVVDKNILVSSAKISVKKFNSVRNLLMVIFLPLIRQEVSRVPSKIDQQNLIWGLKFCARKNEFWANFFCRNLEFHSVHLRLTSDITTPAFLSSSTFIFMGANTQIHMDEGDLFFPLRSPAKAFQFPVSEEAQFEEALRQNAERMAEMVLSTDDAEPIQREDDLSSLLDLFPSRRTPQQSGSPTSPVRPEWQKICIQHSVCIHNIYGNCAYADNCYYYHLEDFKKPDLLFKTELCRYGADCVNRPRCCFAHSKKERRTPEQNVQEALLRNHFHLQQHAALNSHHSSASQAQQPQFQSIANPALQFIPTPRLSALAQFSVSDVL